MNDSFTVNAFLRISKQDGVTIRYPIPKLIERYIRRIFSKNGIAKGVVNHHPITICVAILPFSEGVAKSATPSHTVYYCPRCYRTGDPLRCTRPKTGGWFYGKTMEGNNESLYPLKPHFTTLGKAYNRKRVNSLKVKGGRDSRPPPFIAGVAAHHTSKPLP